LDKYSQKLMETFWPKTSYREQGELMAKKKESAQSTVRTIRRKTRKKYSAEDKIRIVIEGLRGEATVAELCRKEGISQSLYYSWSKEFLEAGKSRLAGDTKRNADASEVKEMRGELEQLTSSRCPSGSCWLLSCL
jgi:transposase